MPPQRERPLVLVIDDVEPILRIIQLELKIHGFDVAGIDISDHVYAAIERWNRTSLPSRLSCPS